MRAAIQTALSEEAGSQLTGAATGASPGATGAHVLGNGYPKLGNGTPALPAKDAQFVGQGKNEAEAAKVTQSVASAPQGAAAAAAAQAAATGGSSQDLAALKGIADSARDALAAAQSSQAAQTAQTVQATNAAGAAIAPNAAAAAASLSPPVGTSDWEDALSQKVVFLSNAHQQSAELSLNPPDLGPLQVVLQVANNHAHALFVSQHQQVRDAVEASLPKLRDALASGGLSLGSTSVSDGSAQQFGQQGRSSGGNQARQSAGGEPIDDATATIATVPTRRTVGLVDTFA
jgi:flagellar hook-length control protein FliK